MKKALLIAVVFGFVNLSHGQEKQKDTETYKHFFSTSLWSIANLFPEPADFYELDYGYRFNSKNVFVARAFTWKYNEPLGIPYGPSFESEEEEYPGYVRAFGVGIGYKRYVWKGLFAAVHATPFVQNFYDLNGTKIQNGFQLYLQFQTGYHIGLFNNRCFLEPSLAFNYWPINTNMPESFQQVEKKWPNYFLFEPHLNFGINF